MFRVQLSRKADASSLQPLITRAADTAAHVADLSRRCNALEARDWGAAPAASQGYQQSQVPGTVGASRPVTPLSVTTADGLSGRVQGMESSLQGLNHMLTSLQDTLHDVMARLGSLGDKVGSGG